MPDDSSGNAIRPAGNWPVTGQTALAEQVNTPVDDLYACMTRRYMRDGRAPMLGNIPMNGHRAVNAGDAVDGQDYVTLSQMQDAISAITGVPVGVMLPYTVSASSIPIGYLVANGQTVDRGAYPELWAAVEAGGNLAASQSAKTHGQYGPGNGSTTFTLPNLYANNGYFIRPISSGRLIGTVQQDEFKEHDHAATFKGDPVPPHSHGYTTGYNNGNFNFPARAAQSGGGTVSTNSGGGHTPSGSVVVQPKGSSETRPKNIAYPVLIKAL